MFIDHLGTGTAVLGITDSVSEGVVDSWFYTESASVLWPHHNILIHNLILTYTGSLRPFFYFELNLRLSVHVSKSTLRREHALGHGVGYFGYAAALL